MRNLMMQCQCPACGRASRIPVDEAVQCCWCGRWLNASAGRKAAPFAEPERPKVRLEKVPRVSLDKNLPAASAAALPQRAPKSQPVIPQQPYCSPPEIDPEWILHEQKKRKIHYVADAAAVLASSLYCFLTAVADGAWNVAGFAVLLGVFTLPYAVVSAMIRYDKQRILGRKRTITAAVTLVCFFLHVGLTVLGIWGGSTLGAKLH